MTDEVSTRRRPAGGAREWWTTVCHPRTGDAASRARLRRCRATNDVLAIPAGVRLPRMLGDMPARADHIGLRFERALDLARVLAHVTEDVPGHPMHEVGWRALPGKQADKDKEGAPKLNEARFRRLLQAERGEDLVSQFTRLIALMGGRVDVSIVSDAFRWWDHPEGRTKQRWAFEYFNAGAAIPPDNDSPEEPAE